MRQEEGLWGEGKVAPRPGPHAGGEAGVRSRLCGRRSNARSAQGHLPGTCSPRCVGVAENEPQLGIA